MKKHSTTLRFSDRYTVYFSVILSLFMTQIAYADFNVEQLYKENRLDYQFDSQYYKTTANFNSSGKKSNLVKSNYLQNADFHTQIRWGLFDSLGLRLGANIGYVETSNNIITDVSTRTSSAVNKVEFGTDFLFFDSKKFQAIIDFEYDQNMYTFKTTTDDVINGTGASEVKPTLILRMPFGKSVLLYGYSGVNYRLEGLSSLLTYGLGMNFDFSGFGFGAALKGYTSVIDDKDTDKSYLRDDITTRVNAGSLKYYSVNPNLTSAELSFTFIPIDEALLKINLGYDVAGSNISQGYYAGASLIISFDGFDHGKMFSSVARRKKTKEPVFKEETQDGVNQDIFKPITPLDESEEQNLNKNNESTSEPKDEDIQINSLKKVNSTEQKGYKIQLKKVKKKKKPQTNNE